MPDQATRKAAHQLDMTEKLVEFNKMLENHLHSPKDIIREGGTTKPEALLKALISEGDRIQSAMNQRAVQKIADAALSVNVSEQLVSVLQRQFLLMVQCNNNNNGDYANSINSSSSGATSRLGLAERHQKEEELIDAVSSLVLKITNGVLTKKTVAYFLNIIYGRQYFVANTGNFIDALIEMAVSRVSFEFLNQ